MVNFNKMYRKLSVIIILCLSLIFIVTSIFICNYKDGLNKLFMVREIKQQEREIKSKMCILFERNVTEAENHEFEKFLKNYVINNVDELEIQREEVNFELSHYKRKNDYILDISILNNEGVVIESSLSSNIGKVFGEEHKEALENSIIYGYEHCFNIENKSFNLISPIYDKKTGNVLGYYNKNMSIKYVQDILNIYNKSNRSNNEFSFLILENGSLITEAMCKEASIKDLKEESNGLYDVEIDGGTFASFTNCKGIKMKAIAKNVECLDIKIIYSIESSCYTKGIVKLILVLFIVCTLICISFIYIARKIVNNIKNDLEQVSTMIYEYKKTGGISDEFLIKKKKFNLIGKEVFSIIKRFELEKVNYDYIKNKSKLDGLTGFLNKEYTKKYIEEYIRESSDGGAFILFDLDNFKGINDNFGHQFGDEVLKEIGKEAKAVFNESDIFGRIGGDEFVVFVKGKDAKDIIDSKINILSEVLKKKFTKGNILHEITGSIGVSFYPKDATTYKELYNNADIAMYHSKENGKNNVTIYSKEIKTKSQLEDESISKAIEILHKIKLDLYKSIKLIPVKEGNGNIKSYIVYTGEAISNHGGNTNYVINNIIDALSAYKLDEDIYFSLLDEVFKLLANIQEENKDIVIDLMILFNSISYDKAFYALELLARETTINTKNIRIFFTNNYIDLDEDVNLLIRKLKALGFSIGIIEFSSDKFLYKNYSKYDVDEIYISNNEINSIIKKEEGLSLIKHTISYYNSIGINVTLSSLEASNILNINDFKFKYYNINEGIDIKEFIKSDEFF